MTLIRFIKYDGDANDNDDYIYITNTCHMFVTLICFLKYDAVDNGDDDAYIHIYI